MRVLAPLAPQAKILVVMPSYLGDAVMATAALQLLRLRSPSQPIYLLVRPTIAGLFSSTTLIDEKLLIDHRHTERKQSLWQLAAQLRAEGFQRVYHFRNSFADALVCWLAGIPQRIGYQKNGCTPLLSHSFKLDSNYHYQYRYCHLVAQSCHGPEQLIPATKLHADFIALPNRHLPVVVAYFGGKNKGCRHYPFELAARCLSSLALYRPYQLLLVGDSQETAENAALAHYLQQQQLHVTDNTGVTSVPELMTLIHSADLVISIDSAQLHIAAALGTPYIAVVGFGTSPWSCVAPTNGQGIHLVAPCQSLDLQQQICQIEPRQIVQAARQLLRHVYPSVA